MIISSISFNNVKKQNYSFKTLNFKSNLIKNTGDYFVRSGVELQKTALDKIKKINFKEYLSLSELEKAELRNTIKFVSESSSFIQNISYDVKLHDLATECVKQALENEFGSGNFVAVFIGRSLSSISKLLELKIGEDNVKNIPLSNLEKFRPDSFEPLSVFNQVSGIEDYKKYLESISLSKNDIEESGKNFVIIDYASTGNSIKNAYKILTSDSFWENNKRNVIIASIQDFLPNDSFNTLINDLIFKLNYSAFKQYSNVRRLSLIDSEHIKFATNPETVHISDDAKFIHKLFGFALLDNYYTESNSKYAKIIFDKKQQNDFAGQHTHYWLTPNKQFNNDVFIDLYELDKAIIKADSDEKKENLKELRRKLKYDTSPVEYYNKLKSIVAIAIK